MVEKSQAYDNFLKSFRIALTNTSVYFKEHPLFIKSIENLRNNINQLLFSAKTLVIGVTPDSLLFGEDCLKDQRLYREIAGFLHHRKVKTLTLKEGVNNQELISFLVNVNLSPRDILFKGGLSNILKEERLSCITVEDLDYSQLLRDGGEEYGDIWLFLLKKGLKQGDSKAIDGLAGDFKKVLKKIRVADLVENKGVNESIAGLLQYLKEKDIDKFSQCSRELTKSVLKSRDRLGPEQIEKFKKLLNGMNTKDISDVLIDQLKSGEKADSFSLNLFSKLIGRNGHKGVAGFLTEKLDKDEQLNKDPKVISGIKDLLSSPDFSSHESKIYYDNLRAILKNITLGDGSRFDRNQVVDNYRFILMDLFVLETSPERLELVVTTLLSELGRALKANDQKYLENFQEALAKKNERCNFKSHFSEIHRDISVFLEEIIFDEGYALDLGSLTDIIDSSSREAEFYIDKIFKETKATPSIIKLFFKLFPEKLPLFYAGLEKKISDLQFIEKVMDGLAMVDRSLSLDILKHIFSSANSFLKIKALEKMAQLRLNDENFLLSIINEGGFLQRKQVLLILAESSSLREKAVRILLKVSNPFGLKTKAIEENLKLIDEVFFPEAEPYLTALSRYRFFWNKNIRVKAKEILTKNGI